MRWNTLEKKNPQCFHDDLLMSARMNKNTDTEESVIEGIDPIETGDLMTQTATAYRLINYVQRKRVDDIDRRPNRHTTDGNSDATDDIGEMI